MEWYNIATHVPDVAPPTPMDECSPLTIEGWSAANNFEKFDIDPVSFEDCANLGLYTTGLPGAGPRLSAFAFGVLPRNRVGHVR